LEMLEIGQTQEIKLDTGSTTPETFMMMRKSSAEMQLGTTDYQKTIRMINMTFSSTFPTYWSSIPPIEPHILPFHPLDITPVTSKPSFERVGKFPSRFIPSYIMPEVTGCAVGGGIALLIALCAFAIGQTGAGIALLGPFLASVLGILSLVAISKKVDMRE